MLNNLECPAIPEMANDYKKIMAEWSNRTITAELNVQICEVACKHKECIDDFRWRPEPTIPVEYARFRSMSPKDRDAFVEKNPTFFVKGKVYDYLEQRDRIIVSNKRNMFTLLAWVKLPVSDQSRSLIEMVINSFSGKSTEDSYNQKIMGIFYKKETPAEIKQLADQVGGTVINYKQEKN